MVFSKSENELRCFSNGIGVGHFKSTCAARISGQISGEFCSYPARHARGRTPNVKYPRAAYPRRADGCASADGIARRARMNLLRALVALHGFSLHGNTTRFTSHGRNPRISAAFAYLARPAFRIPRIAALPPHRSSPQPLCASPSSGESSPSPKKAVRRFFEPLFIFGLPLPADSESRKVKKEPHRAV